MCICINWHMCEYSVGKFTPVFKRATIHSNGLYWLIENLTRRDDEDDVGTAKTSLNA